ncbi:MAG: cupredoxin domain-containing protein, partial [Bryobacteraceae bacterium]
MLVLLLAAPAAPDRTVHIVAERFSFAPSRIKVKQGTEVELVVTSEDTDHGFKLAAANIDAAVPQRGRGELRVRFRARQKGRYAFECSR